MTRFLAADSSFDLDLTEVLRFALVTVAALACARRGVVKNERVWK